MLDADAVTRPRPTFHFTWHGGATRKALRKYCTAALDEPPDGSVLERVDAALAAGGSSGLAAAMRIAADAAPRVDLAAFRDVVIYMPPPPEMTMRCKIRFHTNTVDGWTDEFQINDFFAVYSAFGVHNSWSTSPAWVASSLTGRAFEAGGQQILAGMTLAEMTAPKSVCNVFDFEEQEDCEGTKYGTYTIFIGSDYQLAARGGAPVDKCACFVEAVRAYMASRAAA